jgi:phosphinothricin acetyltransferase
MPRDLPEIAAIYNHYIRTSVSTFEEQQLSDDEVKSRIQKVRDASLPWLVTRRSGAVVGYCYARPWHERAAYRYSVETSLYVVDGASGQGIGTAMYAALLKEIQAKGLKTAIAGISLPNAASVALHEKFGFQKAAHYHSVGFKFNEWIDVGYWQLSW